MDEYKKELTIAKYSVGEIVKIYTPYNDDNCAYGRIIQFEDGSKYPYRVKLFNTNMSMIIAENEILDKYLSLKGLVE